VDQILGQILRQAVWERLDMLDELAASCSSIWRPQKAPCSVWQAAHHHLVTPEQPTLPAMRVPSVRAVPAPVRRAALR
jgi:hypothetical protein